MATLDRRIAVLEQAQPDNAQRKTVAVEFVESGNLHSAIDHLSTRHGEVWARHECESEQVFKDRARREVKRSPWGVALLFAKESTGREDGHAQS